MLNLSQWHSKTDTGNFSDHLDNNILYRKRKKSKYTTSSNDYVKYKPSSSKEPKSAGKKKQSGATGIQLSEKKEKVEDDVIDEQCYENTSFIGKQLCVHDYSTTHL